jgi:peptidoglycan/LPS O-acetylase OafA/YrhL
MMGGKILYLESLRGIAALTVALHHFRVNTPIADNTFVANGWLMVDFFFVLSGFVISLNYQEEIRTFSDLATFQIKRLLRLYPLHFVMLLVFLVIETAKYFVTTKMGLEADHAAFTANNVGSFLHNLVLTQSIFIDDTTWNGPSWSISAEFYTYIAFALLVLAFRRNYAAFLVASSVMVLIGFISIFKIGYTFDIVRCFYSFFIGVLVLNLANRTRMTVSPTAMATIAGAIVVALSVVEWSAFEPVTLMFPLLFGMLILSLVLSPAQGLLKRTLEDRRLVYLGTISYGIYMVHTSVWWVINQVMKLGLHFPTIPAEEGGSLLVIRNQWLASVIAVAGLAIIICLAHLSYSLIEMPINRLRHKLGTSVAKSSD